MTQHPFADAVWKALKGDHNDLRRQAIILEAHREALSQYEKSDTDRDQLREALRKARLQIERIIGCHTAPCVCYATGPLTGDPYVDLVSCPSCEGHVMIEDIDALLASYDSNALTEAESDGWERGMLEAANICGSLAETTYDDSDSFEAATGCEAFIRANMFAHKNARIRAGAKQ